VRQHARSAGTTLDRRRFLALVGAGAAAGLGLAGCTRDDQDPGPVPSEGALGGALRVFSWEEYENPANLEAFAERTGVQVTVDTYASNEEALEVLERDGPGAYDIVVPTGIFIPLMVERELLRPLDKAKLPNLRNVDPAFLDQPWDPGNRHGVVKAWGATGFLYDTTVIAEELTDWFGFFRAASQPEVSGRVSALPDPSSLLGTALWRQGEDWNTTDEALLAAAEQVLRDELVPHLGAFDDYPIEGLLDGTYALCQTYSGDARTAVIEFPERYRWVLPRPLTELWIDNWTITADAPNADAAHAFIDYMLRPNVSARELDFHGYSTAVLGMEEFLPIDLQAGDMIFLPPEQVERLVPGEVNESQERRVEIFDALVAGSGLEA